MFYPMKRSDAWLLGGLTAFAALGFLIPGLRDVRLLGVSGFGWWLAALMIVGPAAALLRIRLEKE